MKELFSQNEQNLIIYNTDDGKTAAEYGIDKLELRAKERKDITMKFWRENVDKILQINDKAVLMGNGKVSNQQMEEYIDVVYNDFHLQRKLFEAQQADLQDIEELEKNSNNTKTQNPVYQTGFCLCKHHFSNSKNSCNQLIFFTLQTISCLRSQRYKF